MNEEYPLAKCQISTSWATNTTEALMFYSKSRNKKVYNKNDYVYISCSSEESDDVTGYEYKTDFFYQSGHFDQQDYASHSNLYVSCH